MKNIYITGFMGTGKSTTGRLLSRHLNRKFIEMDSLIEKQENRTIKDIFEKEGEAYFRNLEKKLLKEISHEDNLVVSCGGGIACRAENLQLMKETGIVFCLTASPASIYERTKNQGKRPLLEVSDPLSRIKELLKAREPYYLQADCIIETDNSTPEEIVKKIIKKA